MVDEVKLLLVKRYINKNYTRGNKSKVGRIKGHARLNLGGTIFHDSRMPEPSCDRSNATDLERRIKFDIDSTWQQTLFNIIDERGLDEVIIYKKASITKQTFSKIRSDINYHPDKDTAIRLCISLRLNIDDTIDFLAKAGYTLSKAIKRDLVIKYFIEREEYDMDEIDEILYELKLKTLNKYEK